MKWTANSFVINSESKVFEANRIAFLHNFGEL